MFVWNNLQHTMRSYAQEILSNQPESDIETWKANTGRIKESRGINKAENVTFECEGMRKTYICYC